MYKSIRKKKIKVNRGRAEPSQLLSEGDTVQLFLAEELFEVTPDNIFMKIVPDISVLYENSEFMLVDKKPGMAVHGGNTSGSVLSAADESGTLINHIKAYLWRRGEYRPEEERSFAPALCNRIDRNTGGIVIAAKTAEALRRINEEIKRGEVTKKYLCAVHGRMEKSSGRLSGWMEKDSARNIVRVHSGQRKKPHGKTMITDYRVLAEQNGLSLLEVTLLTGRTHQIRAQMQAAGHPLLGEGKYGVNRDDRKRGYRFQALYAYSITLEGKSYTVDMNPEKIKFLKEFDKCIL